ncbi:hypothetical protein U9M48_011462 [Paspalum notatum var. saurae]|uniref:Ubiquitin-like domain-containing protein n=1 Tax=Paspalum notatum var. saurae TaxID=547442 RepID=A0AAQ3SXF2_PASNO
MHISVRSPTGRTIFLKVRPTDTLKAIKAKILEQHCFVFDGKELDDNLTLAYYGIDSRSTLELVEKMQIHVTETRTGRTLSLLVDTLDTIDTVKVKIEDMEGFPKGQQCLIFDQKQLEDDRTLADQNILMDSTLLLVLRSFPRGTMHLFVKNVTGQTLTLYVESSYTVASIKVMLYEKEGASPIQQRLIYQGRQLEDRRTLADYNMQDQSTIHMWRQLRLRVHRQDQQPGPAAATDLRRTMMHISVRSPTGRTIFLKVRPSDTLQAIKAKILEQHCFVFDGKELDDSLTLADYDIKSRSTLELVEKMQIHVTETLTGRTLSLPVDSLDTIDTVKGKIQDMEVPFG